MYCASLPAIHTRLTSSAARTRQTAAGAHLRPKQLLAAAAAALSSLHGTSLPRLSWRGPPLPPASHSQWPPKHAPASKQAPLRLLRTSTAWTTSQPYVNLLLNHSTCQGFPHNGIDSIAGQALLHALATPKLCSAFHRAQGASEHPPGVTAVHLLIYRSSRIQTSAGC